ncbi:MAG: ATP-binding protein [Myxococcaceae bacterium]
MSQPRMLASGGDQPTLRLVDALVRAAGRFVRCQDEDEILEAAADALHQEGHLAAVLLLEGDVFVHKVLRHDEQSLALGRALYGVPVEQVRIPLERLEGMSQMIESGRALFHDDMHAVADALHPTGISKSLRALMPRLSGVSAPILVTGRPFGVLSVQGPTMSQASMGTVELLARMIGGALENVRYQRRAEEQLSALNELQEAFVHRERLAAVGQAAGVLSHEARNPLGAILNALAVLRRQQGLDHDGRMVLDIAEEEALRLDALVRDLLELARPLEPRVREVDVAALLEATVETLPVLTGRRINVHLHIRDRVLARADPVLLKLALENLMRNAAQAGPAGIVTVEVARDGGTVLLAVADSSSTGIAPLDDAFDPFSLTRPRGTGLGLAVVKRVIEAQAGSVRSRSDGSRLEVLLPLLGE